MGVLFGVLERVIEVCDAFISPSGRGTAGPRIVETTVSMPHH